jgi:hypothetical protein
MLNRHLVVAILAGVNVITTGFVGIKYGFDSLNNWLLILSTFFMSITVYRLLGLLEGYK